MAILSGLKNVLSKSFTMKLILNWLWIPVMALGQVWTPIGPPGGQINSVALDRNNPGIVFAGVQFGGLFKSVDFGKTWEGIGTSYLRNKSVYVVKTGLNNSSTYIITWPAAIYKSTDMGHTWTHVGKDTLYRSISDLAIADTNDDILYVASYQGAFKSLDGGQTFQRINSEFENPGTGLVAIAHGQRDNVIISSLGYLYHSLDGGGNWERMNSVFWSFTDVVFDPFTADIIYVGTMTGLQKSTDGGKTFIKLENGLTSDRIRSVAINPKDNTVLYCSTDNGYLFKSTNAGESWINIGTADLHEFIITIQIDPLDTSRVFAGTLEGGLFLSENSGESWGLVSVPGRRIGGMSFSPIDTEVVYATVLGGGGVWKTENGGKSWQELGLRNYYNIEAVVVDPLNAVYIGAENEVLKSEDGGLTWVANAPAGDGYDVVSIAVDQEDPSVIYAGLQPGDWSSASGVYKSTDGGKTWSGMNNGLPIGYLDFPNNIVIHPEDNDLIYTSWMSGIYVTYNGGSTWEKITEDENIRLVSALAIDTHQPEVLFAGTYEGHLFRSEDGGLSWQELDNEAFAKKEITSIQIHPGNSDIVIIGTDSGLFYSPDHGSTWMDISGNLTNSHVRNLQFHPIEQEILYVGTFGGSILRTFISKLGLHGDGTLLTRYRLHQNHPNPFNPVTTIRYELPRFSQVRLSVYDILGREIAVLADTDQSPGLKQVQWNASNVPSGIYFIQMVAGDFRQVRKVMVLK